MIACEELLDDESGSLKIGILLTIMELARLVSLLHLGVWVSYASHCRCLFMSAILVFLS